MKTLLSKLIPAMLLLVSLNATAVTRYVDLNSPSPTPPYTDWSTAATNIQDAIDAAVDGDLVLVTNGTYATGGRVVFGAMTNRVAVTKAITVQSVNGPEVTFIEGKKPIGSSAVRCVYLTNNSVLVGFTLTNGATTSVGDPIKERSGGGVLCESVSSVISNCAVVNNSAWDSGGGISGGTVFSSLLFQNNTATIASTGGGGGAYASTIIESRIIQNFSWKGGGLYGCQAEKCLILTNSTAGGDGGASGNGGGAYQGYLVNCLLVGNTSGSGSGGGAFQAVLSSCTVAANSASLGGGVVGCSLSNSIVYHNTLAVNSVNHSGSTFWSCCTTNPLVFGNNNIATEPAFANLAAGDFRLQANSPCINAGDNAQVTAASDLAGNSRIVAGAVDIGAYEFQSPASILSYAWAQQYGFPTDGSADIVDTDGDGMNNYGEWRSVTSPTNALSVWRIGISTNNPTGAKVTWQSFSTRNYWLERATNLAVASPFQIIATNITGVAGTKTFTDTSATNGGPYFYRVGVH